MNKVEITSGPFGKEGFAKVVKQKNHDGGRIPPELSAYAEQPLYILIALWCWQQKTWVGQKQISMKFAITERRASFQISYILRKKECVHSLTRKVKHEGTRRLCREIWIEEVMLAGQGQ